MAKKKMIIKVADDTKAKKTDEQIKAESDIRRRARKQQRIRIHAGSIENLDETEAEAKKNACEVRETGYKSVCRIYYRESRLNWLRKIVNKLTSWAYAPGECCMDLQYINRMELKRNFVKIKVVTRCVTLFLGKNKGENVGLVMQPVPVEYLNRITVEHIEKKSFGLFRRFPYYMDLNSLSAVELFRCAGINPLVHNDMKFRLVEIDGKSSIEEMAKYYELKPIGSFTPMEMDKPLSEEK